MFRLFFRLQFIPNPIPGQKIIFDFFSPSTYLPKQGLNTITYNSFAIYIQYIGKVSRKKKEGAETGGRLAS